MNDQTAIKKLQEKKKTKKKPLSLALALAYAVGMNVQHTLLVIQ